MERIAIIDLGSNSIRFIIMQIGEHGAYKLIYQEKKSIRLAEGMTLTSRLLTEEAQQRALSCLAVYSHIIEVQKIKKVLAVATAAVRNAINGASFLKRVRMSTGIPMTIISGKAEAFQCQPYHRSEGFPPLRSWRGKRRDLPRQKQKTHPFYQYPDRCGDADRDVSILPRGESG